MSLTTKWRFRERGGISNKVVKSDLYLTEGTYYNYAENVSDAGTHEEMWDFVTKPFVPGKTLLFNPMVRKQTIVDHIPMRGEYHLEHPGWTGYIGRDVGEKFVERDTDLHAMQQRLNNLDYSRFIKQACTAALGGIRKPEVSGLVGLAEFKETLQTLRSPLKGALNFVLRNAKAKRRKSGYRHKDAMGSLNDVSDQHLTIVFGLMPFISDIQGILKALKVNYEPSRLTSRGQSTSYDVVTESGSKLIYNDGNNKIHLAYNDVVKRTVTVRASQLYEHAMDLQQNLGLTLDSVPVAMWQVATLSFVVDWFFNVGQYLSAISPKVGTNLLISGYTVQTVDTMESHYSTSVTRSDAYGWAGSYSGGVRTRVEIVKQREEASLGDHLAIVRKSNMHHDFFDDIFKMTASLSLLTQRLGSALKQQH